MLRVALLALAVTVGDALPHAPRPASPGRSLAGYPRQRHGGHGAEHEQPPAVLCALCASVVRNGSAGAVAVRRPRGDSGMRGCADAASRRAATAPRGTAATDPAYVALDSAYGALRRRD